MSGCTCTFGPESHEHAVINGGGHRYAVYLDDFDQDVTFDPECPFHGDDGSMVFDASELAQHAAKGRLYPVLPWNQEQRP